MIHPKYKAEVDSYYSYWKYTMRKVTYNKMKNYLRINYGENVEQIQVDKDLNSLRLGERSYVGM